MNPDALLLANLAATLFLTGLAWFMQIVQLPLFSIVRAVDLAAYAARQRRRNTALMVLPMAVESVTAVWLWRDGPPGFSGVLFGPLVLLALIWLVTWTRYIPLYSRLLRSYDEAALQQLIAWNWVRTLGWSGRAGVMAWIAAGRLHIY